jgi:RsiW-degrading membrane proteinase PrsW (M82 family)
MAQHVWMAAPQDPPRRGLSWLKVLLSGLGLFVVATVVMFLTGNPNLYPTVILIGNFLIPVVFVTFLYHHQHLSALTLPTVAQSFFIGGLLGVLLAAVLEPLLVPTPANPNDGLPLSSAMMVGLVEEGCKIVAVAWLSRRVRHTAQMDGLLLGAAVGMGFAALESMGYAFSVFLTSQGHVGASIASTLLRGVLSPFGHGCWTAILGAVLFRQSAPNDFRINAPVVLTYLFVTVLHGLWDGLPHTLYLIVPPGIPISVATLTISVTGIVVLAVLYRQALHQELEQAVPAPAV